MVSKDTGQENHDAAATPEKSTSPMQMAMTSPAMEEQVAVSADMRIAVGLVTLVIDIAPVTSE